MFAVDSQHNDPQNDVLDQSPGDSVANTELKFLAVR
jgi:hypothetical protein